MWKGGMRQGGVRNKARRVGGGQPDIEQQPEDLRPHLGRASKKHLVCDKLL